MARTMSPREAIEVVRAEDSLGFGLGPAVPGGFLHALGERDDWTKLELSGALIPDLYAVMMKPGVHIRSGFFGPAERFLRDAGASIDYVPADFRGFGPILRSEPPRIMGTAGARRPDGKISLSLHAGATIDELRRAGADPDRVLLVEVSPHFPVTYGVEPDHPHCLDLDEIDVLVESDARPLLLPDADATEVESAIADQVLRFVSDGCTLQTGIGGVPSMVAKLLAAGPYGDFGVHSEMFTNGLMHLHRAGKVTNRKGTEFDGYSVTTFSAGTEELYQWLDGNDEVRFLPVDIVNSPELIARNRKAITINGAMMIDLSSQVVADTINGKQFSGVGGHEDFVSGPRLSPDDRSLLCMPSTATVNSVLVSRVMAQLPMGSVISTPRHNVDVVVTEYGAAELRGRTIRERARLLAGIAHPDFREELLAAAERWPID